VLCARAALAHIEGALAPVEIDMASQRGTYEEPNVWVWYSV
jgi:hypothetical protein